jgi:hypothetical protein
MRGFDKAVFVGAGVIIACGFGALTVAMVSPAFAAPADEPEAVKPPFTGQPVCSESVVAVGGECWGPLLALPEVPITDVPCVTEDSDNCYWDATSSGNGEGRSFVVVDGKQFFADEPEPVAPAPVAAPTGEHTGTVVLNGETWQYTDGWDTILYCELPLTVGIDVDNNGNEWAACM